MIYLKPNISTSCVLPKIGTRVKNLTGMSFGRLTPLNYLGNTVGRYLSWFCECSCGGGAIVRSGNLKSGKTQSCGCLEKSANITHGLSSDSSYQRWICMMDRCYNPGHKFYHRYGGRGIYVCEEWHDVAVFISWVSHTKRSGNVTMDRIDNNGNYCPTNCRWASQEVQQNNRSSNRIMTHNGVSRTMTQWARIAGIKPSTLAMRMHRGWSTERALTETVRDF